MAKAWTIKSYSESPKAVREWFLVDWWEKSFIGENPIERVDPERRRWVHKGGWGNRPLAEYEKREALINFEKVCRYVLACLRLRRRIITDQEHFEDVGRLTKLHKRLGSITLIRNMMDRYILTGSTFAGYNVLKRKKPFANEPWIYEEIPKEWKQERIEYLNELYQASGFRGFQLLMEGDPIIPEPDDLHGLHKKLGVEGLDHTWESCFYVL
ncbi:MAG: hypothetical protein AAGM67_00275 [Bacteroidota bacterium]